MVDKELEKYYEAQFSLFLEPGWKDFLEDIQRAKDALPKLKEIKGAEQLSLVQGQLDILDWILERKNLVETAYKDIKED
jgi:hypothetical protein